MWPWTFKIHILNSLSTLAQPKHQANVQDAEVNYLLQWLRLTCWELSHEKKKRVWDSYWECLVVVLSESPHPVALFNSYSNSSKVKGDLLLHSETSSVIEISFSTCKNYKNEDILLEIYCMERLCILSD